MHAFANPARFLKIARPVTAWLLAIGMALVAAGTLGGLLVTPPDYLQGETVRILYIHVPAAWLGMAGWGAIAAASISQIVWRHPLAQSRAARLPYRAQPSPHYASPPGRSGDGRPGEHGGNGTAG
jgi:heme exporter protein C